MNTISKTIKEERKKAGITQKDFAERSGLGLRFVRELNAETGFKWLNVTEPSKEQKEEIPDITVSVAEMHLSSKDEVLANFLADELAGGRVKATEIMNRLYELGIGTKALKRVKKIMGIKSVRRRGQWYWELKKDE